MKYRGYFYIYKFKKIKYLKYFIDMILYLSV